MNELRKEKLGENVAYFGKAFHFQHRGVQYLLVAPSVDALTEAWFDIHPSVKALNIDQVKDVGVMAEHVVRSLNGGTGP